MPRINPWRRFLAAPLTFALIAGGLLVGAAPAVAAFDPDAGPFVTATPSTITPEALADTGVRIQGQSLDTGGSIQRQDITVTAPDGSSELIRYFNPGADDGTFDVTFTEALADSQLGTYTVDTAGFAGQASLATASTTFVVAGEESPPPASISVAPGTITGVDFAADGVQASGRTFDSGSEVNIERSDLVLTAPSGATANYFDLTSDGTFNVNIVPKGDVASNPVETGTYTLRATSLQDPSFTASTTFQVIAPAAPPVDRDPEANATPESLTQSEFLANGVNLTGFTEDTPGPLTRQRIQVTTPGGDVIECADFTGDGTYDIQVYPSDAPEEGPDGQRVCDLSTGGRDLPGSPATPVDLDPVPVGTYQVTSFGFISEDARASTSFEVTADPVPPVDRDPEANANPERLTQSEFLANGVNLTGFTEDTPGSLTRQRIQVTTPGGDVIECADFTGDGTHDIQVYPSDAPEEGPDGQRVCDLSTGGLALPGSTVTPADLMPVPVGTYEVVSFGFISEDARATTSFEVVADPVPPGEDDTDGDQNDGDQGDGDQNVGDQNGNGDNVADNAGNGVLPDAGGASLLTLLAGLALLGAGGVIVAARRTDHGRHIG